MSLLAPVLLLGLLHHQLESSSSRADIYGFHESHGFHLPHTLWSAQAWTVRVPYVAQVREKRVMAGGRTQWVDVQKRI